MQKGGFPGFVETQHGVPNGGCYFDSFAIINYESRDFLGIAFSAGYFRAGAQKDITVIFEEQFSVINLHGWYESGLFTMENVIIVCLPILLDIVLAESSFKIILKCLVFY